MCANQNAEKSCKISDKTLTQKADRDIFERLLVIEGNREVNMKEILTYSLGPIQWALAPPDGGLLKPEKSKLLEVVECDCADHLVSSLLHNCVPISDGMVLTQPFLAIFCYRMPTRNSSKPTLIFVYHGLDNLFVKKLHCPKQP